MDQRFAFLLGLTPLECSLCRRLLLSVVLGMMIGFERRRPDRPAGVRTMSLVSLGSCIFTIDSMFAFSSSPDSWDSSRVAAAIPSGVGFLGASWPWSGVDLASRRCRSHLQEPSSRKSPRSPRTHDGLERLALGGGRHRCGRRPLHRGPLLHARHDCRPQIRSPSSRRRGLRPQALLPGRLRRTSTFPLGLGEPRRSASFQRREAVPGRIRPPERGLFNLVLGRLSLRCQPKGLPPRVSEGREFVDGGLVLPVVDRRRRRRRRFEPSSVRPSVRRARYRFASCLDAESSKFDRDPGTRRTRILH